MNCKLNSIERDYLLIDSIIPNLYKEAYSVYFSTLIPMFSLSQIKNYFPPYVGNEEFMLKEYLQYKILKLIFGSIYGRKLSFL